MDSQSLHGPMTGTSASGGMWKTAVSVMGVRPPGTDTAVVGAALAGPEPNRFPPTPPDGFLDTWILTCRWKSIARSCLSLPFLGMSAWFQVRVTRGWPGLLDARAGERAGAGIQQGRWSDRFMLGREGPQVSLVATVLPHVPNGYMSIEARTTSTGEGKNT